MLAAFKKHIETYFPELRNAHSLLAISGGRDSVVLAHLLKACDISFSFAHVNFKLRHEASDADQLFVETLASTLEVTFYTTHFKTKELAHKQGISTQMAARDLRYNWFKEIQVAHKMPFLLTAHHLDDQLETFLINLNRGSGIDGLTGIPSHNGSIRRPLLPFSRNEITQYALKNNITWREDMSNASNDYLRNNLRNNVLPVLYEVLPNLQAHLQQSFQHIKGSQDIVGDAVTRFRESEMFTTDNATYIPITSLLQTSNPTAYMYELLKHESPHMNDVMALLEAQTGKYVMCGNTKILRDRANLVLTTNQVLNNLEAHTITNFNSTIKLQHAQVTFERCAVTQPLEFVKKHASINTILLDAKRINDPLVIRNWQTGDKIAPYGMKGVKLVSDLLIDHKFSLIAKEKVVVLTCKNKILGVLGVRSSKHFLVTQHTKDIIKITYQL